MTSLHPIETTKGVVSYLARSNTSEPSNEHDVAPTPPLHPDESPIDPDTSKARLEKSLAQRPDKKELMNKNILKSSNVAPALQAAEADLRRAQIEDKLEHSLQDRIRTMSQIEAEVKGTLTPPPEPDESPIDAEASRARLEKSLQQRPEKRDLIDKNILKGSHVAPALQGAEEELKRAQRTDKLEHALQQRSKPGQLVSEGVLRDDEIPPV